MRAQDDSFFSSVTNTKKNIVFNFIHFYLHAKSVPKQFIQFLLDNFSTERYKALATCKELKDKKLYQEMFYAIIANAQSHIEIPSEDFIYFCNFCRSKIGDARTSEALYKTRNLIENARVFSFYESGQDVRNELLANIGDLEAKLKKQDSLSSVSHNPAAIWTPKQEKSNIKLEAQSEAETGGLRRRRAFSTSVFDE